LNLHCICKDTLSGGDFFELIHFGEPDMPTAIRSATPISDSDVSSKSDSGQLVSIGLFSAIGLLASLAVVLLGIQGVWS
jgi:hypothetical protein